MGRLLMQRSRRNTPVMHPDGVLLELWTLLSKEVVAVLVVVMVEEAVDEEEVKNFMFLI